MSMFSPDVRVQSGRTAETASVVWEVIVFCSFFY